jgi:hypothetical protein
VDVVVKDGTDGSGRETTTRAVTKNVTLRLVDIAELLGVSKQRAHRSPPSQSMMLVKSMYAIPTTPPKNVARNHC